MNQLSADLSDFQNSLVDLFFDESELKQSFPNDRALLRGAYLNDPSNIIDHGSMAKYDASKDWTKTATVMVQWTPSRREETIGTVVASAKAMQSSGVGGFFHSMKTNLELKLGLRDAASIKAQSVSKGLTH